MDTQDQHIEQVREIRAYRKALRNALKALNNMEAHDLSYRTERAMKAIRRVLRTKGAR